MTRGTAGRVPGVQQQEGDAQPRVRGHGGQRGRGRGQVSCDWWRAAVLTSHWSGGSPPGTGWGWTPTCPATAASSASEVNMTRVVKTCHDVTCPGQVHFCQYGGARDASGVFRDGGAAELCLVQAEQVRGGGKTTSPLPGHCAGVPAARRREPGHRGAVRAPLLHPARLGQAQVDIRTRKIFLTIFYPRSVSPIQPDSKVLVTGAGNHVYLLVPQID